MHTNIGLGIRASGTTLSVGELREMLTGLQDHHEIMIQVGDDAIPVQRVDVSSTQVQLTSTDSWDTDGQQAIDLLEEIASGGMTKAAMVKAAGDYLSDFLRAA